MPILDSRQNRRGVGRAAVMVATALAAVLLLSLGGMQVFAAEEVYRIGDGVSAPKLIHKVQPSYTQFARDAHIEGKVVLSIEISTDGHAENMRVLESLDEGLDAQAIKAVSRWRFKPGMKDGRPVRVAATIDINFRLL